MSLVCGKMFSFGDLSKLMSINAEELWTEKSRGFLLLLQEIVQNKIATTTTTATTYQKQPANSKKQINSM